jgi:predicted small metal-binding protein
MAKVINCECGLSLRGETEDEVMAKAQAHMEESHPDLVGTVSEDELRGWIQDD